MICVKCKKEKDKSLFHKNPSIKEGIDKTCKECRKLAQRERRTYGDKVGRPKPKKTKLQIFKKQANQMIKSNKRFLSKKEQDKFQSIVDCVGNSEIEIDEDYFAKQ